ncbi:MAG: S1 RNA-binding domain-containing protein [Leptospirales bacterium]|nr:S1 RNA-binding domain-containing protein [Leptospirales bacterium]
MKSTHIGRDRQQKNPFSQMLEESLKNQTKIQPGTYEVVTVNDQTNKDFVFVTTSRGPALIPREELVDGEGKVRVNRGEKIPAFFSSTENGEMLYTTVPGGRARAEILRAAVENMIPLRGRITRKIKGGYEVQIGEVLAFCPASHMEGNPDLKTELSFIITEARGERVIASHRTFRDAEKKIQKEILMKSIQPGDVVTGTVANIVDFGAFVDIGGLEGLVPLSEIAYQRPAHAGQVLKTGQQVRVKILQIDWKEDKLTLSIRALLDNPWQGSLPFKEGDILEGKVESVKTFGIFVKLPENFTGLIPAGESGIPRGQAFEKHFNRGQVLRVMVHNIDRDREKISLSLKDVAAHDQAEEFSAYMKTQEPAREEMSSFGKLLMDSLNKKK